MDAWNWVLANKIKTVLGLVAALAAVIVLPVQVVAWAEDLTAQKVRELEIAQQAREEVIHGVMRAKHDFDFAEQQIETAEEDLIELEELAEEGVEWTPTQLRKYDKTKMELSKYEKIREDALKRLSMEEHDETHQESN